MPAPTDRSGGYQAGFHRRWAFLRDRHVRDLAWLLDAPNLLDAAAPQWQGRIASLPAPDDATRAWLLEQDRAPDALHAFLDLQAFTRLGRYAEKLLAWYLRQRDDLYAHGVQVRAGQGETIGEFDFLLGREGGLVHWEFATKLYLLESSGHGRHADYFVGPGLADTLGAKVRKIMDRQLALSAHPAARLALPIIHAQALVKGWLFYEECTPERPPGIAAEHCRGFWRPLNQVASLTADAFMILPRLRWLAPAIAEEGDSVVADPEELAAMLAARFGASSAPVLIALLYREGDALLEFDRGFIVPDDWRERAAARHASP